MAEAWPAIAGRMDGGIHRLPVRVYYEDTDAGGIVYHANYLKYCERGRTDYLRVNGILQNGFSGGFFVVRHMTCDFLRPARLDDLLEVETRFVAATGARLSLEQQVRRGADTLFKAAVTVALIDAAGRPRRFSSDLLRLLNSSGESAS
jgi:acyl-CoA thioester hydrolase